MFNFSLPSLTTNLKQLITALCAFSLLSSRTGIGMGLLFSQVSSAEAAFPAVLSLNNLTINDGVIIEGANIGTSAVIQGIEDVNGDGKPDILFSTYDSNISSVYLIFGDNNLPSTIDVQLLNGTNGVSILGTPGSYLGRAFASIPDLTGDGIAEFLITAHYITALGRDFAGQTYLIPGNRNWTATYNPSINALSTFNGASYGDASGASLAIIKNMTGDGRAAILIGVPLSNIIAPNAGETDLFYMPHNLSATNFDLLTMPTAGTGVRFLSASSNDLSGLLVTNLGDLNNDGYTDFGIDSPWATRLGRTECGKFDIIFGRNGSWPANISLDSLTGYGVSLIGDADADLFGLTALGNIDIDGNGKTDLIITSPYNRNNTGIVYVFLHLDFHRIQTFDLRNFNSSHGTKIYGKAANDHLGAGLTELKNWNGDRFHDFAIGAPNTNSLTGEVYVFSGTNGTWPAEIDLNNTTDPIWLTIQGQQPGDKAGFSLSKLDNMMCDDTNELLISTKSAGRAYVVCGQNQMITPTPSPTPSPSPTPIITTSSFAATTRSSSVISSSTSTATTPPTPTSSLYPSSSMSSTIVPSSVNSNTPTSTSRSTITQASSLSVIGPIAYSVTSDPISIHAGENFILSTSIISIPNLQGIDPDRITLTLTGDNFITTVNGTENGLFTYAAILGGYAGLTIDASSCASGAMNATLTVSIEDSTAPPESYNLIFDVEGASCNNATTNDPGLLITTAALLSSSAVFFAGKKKQQQQQNHSYDDKPNDSATFNLKLQINRRAH